MQKLQQHLNEKNDHKNMVQALMLSIMMLIRVMITRHGQEEEEDGAEVGDEVEWGHIINLISTLSISNTLL
jgi:hypothetical protein